MPPLLSNAIILSLVLVLMRGLEINRPIATRLDKDSCDKQRLGVLNLTRSASLMGRRLQIPAPAAPPRSASRLRLRRVACWEM